MPHQHSAEQDAAEAAAARAAVRGDDTAAATLTAAPGVTTRPAARAFSPAQAMALQRAAGNRATSAMLGGGKPVQRIWPEDVDTEALPGGLPAPTTGNSPGTTVAPPAGTPGDGPTTGPQPTSTPTTAPTAAAPTTAPTSSPAPTTAPTTPTPTSPPPPVAAPAPDVAPPTPTQAQPTAPGQTPDPNSAKSDIEWDKITFADVYAYGRPALEMARVIPGWGLFAGAATDAVTMSDDLAAVPSGDYPATTILIGIRDATALVNNAIGHVLYVDQLVQDGLAGSVIGIEFTPLTASVNEALTGIKLCLDGALVFMDVGIMVGAQWNKTHSDPTQAAAWQKIIDGAEANLFGDIFGTIMDAISAASAGAANTEPILQGSRFFGTAAMLARTWKGAIVAWAQSAWNIWGGDAVGAATSPAAPATPAPAQRLAGDASLGNGMLAGIYDGAATILETESGAGRTAWGVIDSGIGDLEAEAAKQMAEIDAVCAELTGGKTLWQVIHDGAMSGVARMHEEVDSLQQFQAGATDGAANAAGVRAQVDAAIAQVQSITVPDVRIPETEVGDGLLADAAEAVINAGAGVANAGLQVAVDGVRSAVNRAKAEAVAPLQAVGSHADEVGEFLATAAGVAAEQTGRVSAKIGQFEQGLAQCNGFEDGVNLLLSGFAEVTGLPQVTVQDLRDLWASVPGAFDQIDGVAASLRQRAAGLSGAGGATVPGPQMAPPVGGGGESGGGGSTDSW